MSQIKYAVFGDVHLMHDRTPTAEIIRDFATVHNNYQPSIFTQCDIIFNAGDLFDQVRNADDDDYLMAVEWMRRYMAYCAQYGMRLRFLKGTPSHDGSQQEVAKVLAKSFPTLDFAYIDDISIEYIPSLGIHVLYIPDECRATNREIYADVISLMHEKGLSQVDIAIMHGAFKFQLNFEGTINRVHFEDEYLRIVKHYINIAHIHTHKVYDRILGQGSFSRLSHNEEEDKGLMVMDIDTSDPSKDKFTFIKNKTAKKYVTVRLRSDDVHDSLAKIEKATASLPNGSYFRVLCKTTHPFYSGFAEIKSRYPHLNVTKDRLDKKTLQQAQQAFVTDTQSYIPLQIGPENIVDLVLERMPKSCDLTSLTILQSELSALK